MRRQSRGRRTVLTLALLGSIVWLFVQLRSNAANVDDDDYFRHTHTADEHAGSCPPELEYLRSLRLTDKILFSRRCVTPVISRTVDRDQVVDVPGPLFPPKQTVDLLSCAGAAAVEPCDPISLEVPHPYPERTYPEFIFGLATSPGRLKDSVDTLSHWMSGSSAKLVAVMSGRRLATADELEDLRRLFASRDIDATIINPADESLTTSQNHFAVVRDMVRLSTPETRWLGILDDDTFFPSLHPLARELDRHDHTRDQYVGALSEDFRAVVNWGYMAFGGAGIFLSLPAARSLDAHLEECLVGTSSSQGDGILRDCVNRHTRAKLTHVHGLHQHDIRGDVSGFFEAGPRPISLHHWKSWYRHPVHSMALIARFCGDCFLQRWRFGGEGDDNAVVLANGYSVAAYPDGLRGVDLGKTEETWGASGGAFELSLGPMREKLPAGAKRGHQLVHAEEVSSKVVRQVYVLRGNSRNNEPDEVVELLWDFDA